MAEKDKKFFWLKLKTEFMNGEVVDFLMSQKNGANYVVLYQMLALKTINTQGRLCSEIGEVIIPFDAEKIQRECKWFDIDTVRVAIELYSKLGLVYKNEGGILEITEFQEMVGSETYWAKQKRLQREGGQVLDNVQHTLISNISNLNSNINNNINNKENKKIKHKYGEFNHILLTDEELAKLKQDYGEAQTQKAIQFLDEAIEMKGYKYKSHYLALKKWVFDAMLKNNQRNGTTERKYTPSELNTLFDNLDEIEI